ncbi:hypothetical protein GGR56DRAFT_635060 [Xylariaceae sp. FL0804]|nr:hypothetical protein GGR56DRAFT_635060 [Xylariaceae sp. FL0804]
MSAPDQPALAPPPGQTSNFNDPPNGNARAYFAVIFLSSLVVLAVCTRAYARIFCIKKVSYQDVAAFMSLGTFAGFLWAFITYILTAGCFVHQWDIRLEAIPRIFRITYLGMVFYEATMGTLKVCILSEWIQIFVPGKTRNGFFWAAVTIGTVNVAYYLASILTTSLICPTHATLCGRSLFIFVSSASVNVVSDLAILVLPLRTIWKLQLPRHKKINISFVFGVGLIACAAAVARLHYSVALLKSADTTFGISNTIQWVLTELTLAYLIFCAPAVPKALQSSRFMRQLFTRIGSSASGSRAQKSGSNKHSAVSGQRSHDQTLRNHKWRRINQDEAHGAPNQSASASLPLQDFRATSEA